MNTGKLRIKSAKARFAVGTAGVIVAVVAAAVGGFLSGRLTARDMKYNEIIKLMDANYLYDFDKSALEDGKYSGMIKALGDDYSYYYNPSAALDKAVAETGSQTRIGIEIASHPDTGKLYIVNVQSQSAAKAAGLCVGDLIISVNGTEVSGKTSAECVALVDKTEGVENSFEIERGGKKLSFKIKLTEFTEDSVIYRQIGNTGYIKIYDFNSSASEQFEKAVDELEKAGVTAMIYDLRDNPGGLTDALGEMLDRILPAGDAVRAKYKSGKITVIKSTTDKQSFQVPSAVLVNKNTASAAELFTLALRDYNAGVSVGEKTYGKGVMQTTYQLSDGSAVKLTTAELCDKNGVTYNKKGITPDIECIQSEYAEKYRLFLTDDKDTQLQAALKYLKNKK